MNDPRTVQTVVMLLGAVALVGMIGTMVAVALGRPMSESVGTVTAGAVGALSSILARTSSAREGDSNGSGK